MQWNILQSACKTGEVIVYKPSVVYLSLFIRSSDYFNSCAIYFWKLDFHPPTSFRKWDRPSHFLRWNPQDEVVCHRLGSGAHFSKDPENVSGPKANFRVKTCWILAQFLAHKAVQIVSITDSSIVLFSKLLKLDLECKHKTVFRVRKVTGTFEKQAPGLVSSGSLPKQRLVIKPAPLLRNFFLVVFFRCYWVTCTLHLCCIWLSNLTSQI